METFNVSLVGVGGQGILLTANLLGRVAALAGLDVKKSEIHGMAQRGGSVASSVRFGEKVCSPIIPAGESDLLVAFDRLEALRPMLQQDGGDLEFVKMEGKVVTLRLTGHCGSCPYAMMTLKQGIETKLQELDPELTVERSVD